MASKVRKCSLCFNECRKRDVVCSKCWSGLAQARRNAISLAPYSREDKNRKFITDLLTCDVQVLNQMLAEHKVKPEALKAVDAEVEAVYTEINAGKA
jgi:hypothetical protein